MYRRLQRLTLPLMTLLLLVAAGLRFYGLGAQSFWNDEGSSYVQATRTFSEIAVNAAADIHPPLYYWFLRVWRGLAGETEFALRYPSALAGVLVVALAYGVGLRLHPNRVQAGAGLGLTAALLVALNTFHITYSQELRMYAALALWGAASIYALVGFFNRPSLWRGAALGVVNALGLWTQYAFPLVMLAQLTVALVWLVELARRRGSRTALDGLGRYVAANVLALVLFAPQLPTALRQVTTWPNTGDASVSGLAGLGALLPWYLIGVTAPEIDASWVAVALILVLFGLHTGGADHTWRTVTPLALCAVPTAIFLAAGLYREGNIKFLLPAAFGFALAVGQGVAVLITFADLDMLATSPDQTTLRATQARSYRGAARNRRRLFTRLAAGAAVLALGWTLARGLPPLYTDPAYTRDDYRAIAARITADTSNHAVILNAPGQQEAFFYYYEQSTPVLTIPAGLNADDAEMRRQVVRAADEWERLYLVLWGDAERDPRGVVEWTLDTTAYETDSTWYGDVRVVQYETEPDWFNVRVFPRARFGEHIRLEEALLAGVSVGPGEPLLVKLVWATDATPTADYRVFLQLLDDDGRLVAGRDAVPVGWARPTTTWGADEQVIDRHALVVPDLPPGTHLTLIVGLYNPAENGERLPVQGPEGDYLPLTPITITEG